MNYDRESNSTLSVDTDLNYLPIFENKIKTSSSLDVDICRVQMLL